MLFMCTFNASKVTFIHFYLNGRLHAVSLGKPSKWVSNFWMVRFLKTESEPNFGFPHIPNYYFIISYFSSDLPMEQINSVALSGVPDD